MFTGSKLATENENITEISIFAESLLYPVVEQYFTIDTKTFLSNLGGSLSLWLELSFLTPFVFLYSLAKRKWFVMDVEQDARDKKREHAKTETEL